MKTKGFPTLLSSFVKWQSICCAGVRKFVFLFRQILDEIDEQGIKIYDLPDCESDEDEDYVEQTKQLKVFKYSIKFNLSLFVSGYLTLLSPNFK